MFKRFYRWVQQERPGEKWILRFPFLSAASYRPSNTVSDNWETLQLGLIANAFNTWITEDRGQAFRFLNDVRRNAIGLEIRLGKPDMEKKDGPLHLSKILRIKSATGSNTPKPLVDQGIVKNRRPCRDF